MQLPILKYRLHLFALVFPIIYFLNYLLPVGDGRLWRLANDFGGLYHDYKIYLFHALNSGHFPLWSPSEGAGFPLYTSPFASLFYPLNALFFWVYPMLGHYPGIVHQGFTLLGVSILCLGLFVWLKSLGIRTYSALMAACVFSVCLKVSDILRFPNAVHTVAWMPWVLYSFNEIFVSEHKIRPLLQLVIFSVFLLTGGYPYFYYYAGFFLFFPYLLCLFVSPIRKWLFPFNAISPFRALFRLALSGLFISIILGPYFYKMQWMLGQTTGREGHDFFYSAEYPFKWLDVLGAFIFPQATQTEGTYYFGVAGTFLILFELIRKPRAVHVYFFPIWALLTTISFTESSPVFHFLWNHMPGFSSLRIWTRIHILIVPLGAWLFASSIQSFTEWLVSGEKLPRRQWVWAGLVFTALLTQLYLYQHKMFHHYWLTYIGAVIPSSMKEIHSLVFGWLAAVFFAVILLAVRRSHWNEHRANVVMGVLALLCIGDLSVIGRFFWSMPQIGKLKKYEIPISAPITPSSPKSEAKVAVAPKKSEPLLEITVKPDHKVTALENRMFDSFRYPRIEGHLMVQNTPQFSVGTFPLWYYNRYTDFLKRTEAEKEYRDILLGIKGGRRLFCSQRIDHENIQSFLNDSNRCRGNIVVTHYIGERLDLTVDLEKPGYVTFIDNWDADWMASIDGELVPIEKLFGTFKSIPVKEGKHQVYFEYRPRFFGLNRTNLRRS